MNVILSIDQIKYPLTGVGRYSFELARNLSNFSEIDRLLLFGGSKIIKTLPVQTSAYGLKNSVQYLLRNNRLAVAAYRIITPQLRSLALRKFSSYLFHGTSFYLPPFAGKSIVTIHDISVYSCPDCHPPERVRYMQAEIMRSLSRAEMIITDSEFTRREVAAYFSWPLDRVRAVPLASSEEFCPRSFELLRVPLAEYSLAPCGYSLFVGTVEPRKNIATLLDAYSMLPDAVRRRWPLVLVGYKGWKSEILHARIADAQREGWVRYLGFVEAQHLPLLFSGARLFIYPSLYEGFGLPVLEAMASGVPVICSTASSLPEVAGDATALCDALDVDALYQLIVQGLEDEEWRSLACKKGLSRAASFSWHKCAKGTVAAYQDVMQS